MLALLLAAAVAGSTVTSTTSQLHLTAEALRVCLDDRDEARWERDVLRERLEAMVEVVDAPPTPDRPGLGWVPWVIAGGVVLVGGGFVGGLAAGGAL